MFKRKELLIILILAGLATILSGYFFDLPFRITEPAACVQLLPETFEETCYPFKILWVNALLALLFWFVVLAAGWWVVKWVKSKKEGT